MKHCGQIDPIVFPAYNFREGIGMPGKIEFESVSYRVPSGDETKAEILRDLSFSVPEGRNLTILGPSGSGKSTLLRLCNRLIEPAQGTIRYHGRPLGDYPVARLRRKIGLVFQTPVLFQDLTLKENLLYARTLDGKKLEEREPTADFLLQRVGLSPAILEQKPETLSAGQAQRLCLARTLAADPDVLLLDEPTSALDPSAKLEIERLIVRLLGENGRTGIFVTHDLEQARRLGGQAAILVKGRIVESGPVEELLDRPKEELTRRFVSGNLNSN